MHSSLFGADLPSVRHERNLDRGRRQVLTLGIAVTSAGRNKAVPDLPTVGETVSGYESVSWSAILAPKGTPRHIIARWNTEINRILQAPDVKARMDSIGLDVSGGTQAHLRKVLTQDIAKWKNVVKAANIKL
jgi:tripartite-type tricarboxylate transporter receptor subunit TctC